MTQPWRWRCWVNDPAYGPARDPSVVGPDAFAVFPACLRIDHPGACNGVVGGGFVDGPDREDPVEAVVLGRSRVRDDLCMDGFAGGDGERLGFGFGVAVAELEVERVRAGRQGNGHAGAIREGGIFLAVDEDAGLDRAIHEHLGPADVQR